MAELVDALDLGSSIVRCESSSLSFRTILYLGKELPKRRNLLKITIEISANDKVQPDFNIGSRDTESRYSQAKTTLKITVGISPSGKAPGFDLGIQRFKSSYPSHIIK